jgi:hypothetical protein
MGQIADNNLKYRHDQVNRNTHPGRPLRRNGAISSSHFVRRVLVMLVTHDLCPILLV